MKNKVVVIAADNTCRTIEETINAELEQGWLIELFMKLEIQKEIKLL